MKILVCGTKERYEHYRPDFAKSLDAHMVFVNPGDSLIQAAEKHSDAQVIFADPIFEIKQEMIARLPQLKLIQSEGVAFHRFDLQAARRKGVYVCNNKGCNASSVAEHTVMLMLMALRYGITGDEAVRSGRQIQMKERVMASSAPELADCAVGLIGFGDIAQATARRLSAFGCQLFYYSRHQRTPQTEQQFKIRYLPLEQLVQTCDIVSLHCAVNAETRNLVDEQLLRYFKPGAILVNTARGDLIDNEAVRRALLEGRLGKIAVDTLSPEPTPADHPLVNLPKEVRDRAVYSPHLGGNTDSSFRRAHTMMWNNVRLVYAGKRPDFIVNGI